MFEGKLTQGSLLKKIIEAIKDIVGSGNWECSDNGMALQAMDSSHVCLVSLDLKRDAFEPYRCDRNITLGLETTMVSKIVKCAGNDDTITISAEDNGDAVTFLFESPNGEKTSTYTTKMMDIDQDNLGIPEQKYDALVKMPSHEFQRIIRDLSQMGDSVIIACTKDGVSFSVTGDNGSGKILLRQNASVDKSGEQVSIDLQEPVSLTFALRYLGQFTKATPLSSSVSLSLKKDIPLVVEYSFEDVGEIKYYLAPKVDEEEMAADE
ncbi:proliferating cell nuclear antigen [Exaiptasia diaphana]|uniref:DNA sliding clamp PCNA n=1 Tax=Exaiptasia diaphana TaxID=2652724 RepID=A0A913XJV7_EXADI|nr:proliferating cell nuclear antigen [Exaiptasia diaphana]KXJ11439.1 Proliferating cell nuclear antigen [Exaiptasia diaphana]